jgi:tRNA(Ile)-lysidine synthase TilS/MesJ
MWNNFEHLVWKKIKHYELDRKKLFLTVSGGVDSLVLVYLFAKLNLTENVIVLHYHHGDFQNKNFRDQALALVQKTCEKMGVTLSNRKIDRGFKIRSRMSSSASFVFSKTGRK